MIPQQLFYMNDGLRVPYHFSFIKVNCAVSRGTLDKSMVSPPGPLF